MAIERMVNDWITGRRVGPVAPLVMLGLLACGGGADPEAVELAQYYQELAKARCERLVECCSSSTRSALVTETPQLNTASTCEAYWKDQWENEFEAAADGLGDGVLYSPTQASSCLAATRSCGDVAPCITVVRGNRPVGAACSADVECATRNCDALFTDGLCRPAATAGTECRRDDDCASGRCDLVDTDFVCVGNAGESGIDACEMP